MPNINNVTKKDNNQENKKQLGVKEPSGDATYVETLTARSKQLESKVGNQVPNELQQNLDIQKRRAVLTSVGQPHYEKRMFSPMIKNLMPGVVVPMSAPFTSVERNIIKYVASVLYKHYGEPKFQYNATYDEDCVRVKMGQALLRISPKITDGASTRRYESLSKYFTKAHYNPDNKLLSEAIQLFIKMMNMPIIHTQGDVRYIKGIFASHSSNVGYPYFANERKELNGKMYREITVEMTKRLNEKYGFGGMTSIPAIIIGRDQSGGINFDLNRQLTYKELVKDIDNGEYKPSKARVVGAIDRLSNNNYNTVLKPLIEHPKFKANPLFCGFTSREERFFLYKRFDKLARDTNMIPVNIDFSSFDTTVGPELMLMAIDIIRSVVKIDNVDNNELYDALAAKAIYTKYTVMNPNNGRIEHGSKATAIPSGLGWTGIIGIIVAQIAGLYGCIAYYGRDHVVALMDKANQHKTFSQAGLGDDALGLVRAFSDLKPIADKIRTDLGLDISVESTKTAVGVDFLQELYGDNKILYPSGRTVSSALYTERPSGLGGAQGDMKGGAQLGNIRQNSELVDISAFISFYDKSRLGLRNPKDNKAITQTAFMAELKHENSIGEASTKEAIYNGNPHLEHMYDAAGELTSSGLKGFFSNSKKAMIFSDTHSKIASLSRKGDKEQWKILK